MSDDLNDLKAAMKAATPAPEATKKAEHLALAQKNFERLQGTRDQARPKSDRPGLGLWTGVRRMLGIVTTRGGLVATSALVAVALVTLTPVSDRVFMPSDLQSGLTGGLLEADDAVLDASIPRAVKLPEPLNDEIASADSGALVAIEQEAPAETRQRRLNFGSANSGLSDERPLAQNSAPPPPPTARKLREQMALGGTVDNRAVLLPAPADQIAPTEPDTEVFSNEASSPLKITTEEPVSTFSIDVDTASYAVVRNSLSRGMMPPKDAIRVEEMINYFPYGYATPTGDDAFRPRVSVSPTPWNEGTQLVHIGIQGAMPDVEDRPPLNLVFLIDTSGSMAQANKLPLLKQSFALMLGQLRPEDRVAIVTYAGSAGQVLAPTPAAERRTILNALERLDAGGSTAGQQGLQQAYSVAEEMSNEGDVTRVILATDGDFNVGLSDPEALKDFIADKRETGTYLSVLGFGRGNLDDATMQALAQNGNGTAAYIDTLGEAQKVLVDQLSGALFPIADDVKIQVEFNPAEIAEYRLIGYETRALRREDFNNDKVDAGDIGAGHSVTALYEVTPVGSDAQLSDPLRYGSAEAVSDSASDELGFLRLRYKAPGQSNSQLIEMPITADLEPHEDAGFAIAIAGFGQLLRGSDYLGDWSWRDAIALANANKGADEYGYRADAIRLMRLASSIAQ